ncbi:MAG: L-histidine N(alpha)-methyltransferase [Gammaproteobacteria bacterium]|jgi:dimethylhistidine N-methyltransferase
MPSNVLFSDYHPAPADFFGEVIDGLARQPKGIPPKFFYDAKGSQLFDAICELPEYYPTRTETGILKQNANDIAKTIGENSFIIEPGSGSGHKIRLLLDALKPHTYMPMDISREHLLNAARQLAVDFPWLEVHAACADFTTELTIPEHNQHEHKIAFFPGSSIGNFEPTDAAAFLRHLGDIVGKNGGLLIGVDLKKDSAILNAAYNDAQGITAQFNKNLLTRINRELYADFNVNNFEHNAFYNEDRGRVEMHLVSKCKQTVNVNDRVFEFADGETIHTENSYKYTLDEFRELASGAGYNPVKVWTDKDNLFSLQFYEFA